MAGITFTTTKLLFNALLYSLNEQQNNRLKIWNLSKRCQFSLGIPEQFCGEKK